MQAYRSPNRKRSASSPTTSDDVRGMDSTCKGQISLGVSRIALGLLIFWGFWDKLLGLGYPSPPEVAVINGGSPTEYYLSSLVTGPLKDFYAGLAGNAAVDFLLMFALFACGLGLILGIASRLTTLGTVAFMVLMFSLNMPDANNPILDYHILCIIFVLTIYWLDGFSHMGLGKWWNDLAIVQKVHIGNIRILG